MSQAFDDVFSRLISEVEQAQRATPVENPLTEPVRTEVSDPEDRVTVVLEGSEIAELRLHPQVMRQSNGELADLLRATVNTALAEHQAATVAALSEQQTDFAALQGRLREIQADAGRSMQAYTQGMLEMLKQAKP